MTLITPISDNNAYFAAGKQSVGGTAVAPTEFFHWLDGSGLDIPIKIEEIWEGDGSSHLAAIIKNLQQVKLKLMLYPRPGELGFLEQGVMGVGSDGYSPTGLTTQVVKSTLSLAANIGNTSLTVQANSNTQAGTGGYPASGSGVIMIDPGLSTEEIVPVTYPVTGSGPYVLSIASSYNGGAGLKQAHLTSAVIESAAIHALSDQPTLSYFSFEVCLGGLNGQAGETVRLRDCKINEIKRSSESGKLLQYEVDVEGIACIVQNSPSTVTLENRQPFVFTEAIWTLNGSTSGDALGVTKHDIDQKNNLDTGIQTGQITLAAIIGGKKEYDVTVDLIMTTLQLMNLASFGSTTGTTDAQTIGLGALSVVYTQPDNFHTVTFTLAVIAYTQVKPPTPKTDGKHYTLQAVAKANSNFGANTTLMTTTVTNAITSTY